MPDLWGALSQSSPGAGVLVDALTIGTGKRATVEVVICNRAAAATPVRLAHAIGGAADAVAQYLLYDYDLPANGAISTARFTLRADDVLRVRSGSGSVTFNVNGIEEDQ